MTICSYPYIRFWMILNHNLSSRAIDMLARASLPDPGNVNAAVFVRVYMQAARL